VRCHANDGKSAHSYVLKISNLMFSEPELDLQDSTMLHVAKKIAGQKPELNLPQPIRRVSAFFGGAGGSAPKSPHIAVAFLGADKKPHFVRCLTFVEGEMVSDLNYLSKRSLRELGALIGRFNLAMSVS
jgi:hypothetical protein